MKKKFLTFALALCMILPAVGCEKGNYTKVEPDYSASEDSLAMHIGGWVAPPPCRKREAWIIARRKTITTLPISASIRYTGFMSLGD